MKDGDSMPMVVGPSGIFIPAKSELPKLVNVNGSITVMCFTWNIASKANNGIYRLNTIFSKIPQVERPDLIAIALQELPPTTLKFHNHLVNVLEKSLNATHTVLCYVRKWSQMMIIFIRKQLRFYTSHPEYKFVASTSVVKPFRTKGAIGICFRLLQTSCIFIASHLTHGHLKSRILDYNKICKYFDFHSLHRRTKSSSTLDASRQDSNAKPPKSSSADRLHLETEIPMKKAGRIFWFGDLNFRVHATEETRASRKRLNERLFQKFDDYQMLLQNDELKIEQSKGLIFDGFNEGIIKFPPTHKFVIGTDKYAENRIPSYTDRVLYWSRNKNDLVPLRYDSVCEIFVSDHKPVYCHFAMKVMK